jgi:hypothetical protein
MQSPHMQMSVSPSPNTHNAKCKHEYYKSQERHILISAPLIHLKSFPRAQLPRPH